jgi:hypothetical protein
MYPLLVAPLGSLPVYHLIVAPVRSTSVYHPIVLRST